MPFLACYCISVSGFFMHLLPPPLLNSGPIFLDQWRSFLNLLVFCLFAHVFPGCSVLISQGYCTQQICSCWFYHCSQTKICLANFSAMVFPKTARNKMLQIFLNFYFFKLFSFFPPLWLFHLDYEDGMKQVGRETCFEKKPSFFFLFVALSQIKAENYLVNIKTNGHQESWIQSPKSWCLIWAPSSNSEGKVAFCFTGTNRLSPFWTWDKIRSQIMFTEWEDTTSSQLSEQWPV